MNNRVTKVYVQKKGLPHLKEKTNVPPGTPIIPGNKEIQVFDEDSGKFILHYIPDYVDGRKYGMFFNTLKYNESYRLSGLISNSQLFGFAPRDYLKNLPARRTKFDRENPKAGLILEQLGTKISETIKENQKYLYEQHVQQFEKYVPTVWRMKDSIFTGGIINLDTQYLYHTDNGNVDDCISGMLTFKNQTSGGDLHLPEYNVVMETKSGSLLLFDGARVSHGVTPFEKLSQSSFRITIVWYALEKFKESKNNYREELNEFNEKQLQKHEKGYYKTIKDN